MVRAATVSDATTFVNGCTNNYFRCNNICKRMRAGRGALPPDSPTSPRTPRREGAAHGGGLCGRCGSPAPCLPCGGGDGSLPPACAVPQCARCRDGGAGEGSLGLCAGGGLAGDGTGVGWRGAGLECARAPALGCPFPAPRNPTDRGRGAERAPPCPHATLSPMTLGGFYRRSN